MSNTATNSNTNTVLTADDLRKLIRVHAHHVETVVDATEPENDVATATLVERTEKLYATSKAMEEFFHIFYVDQGSRLDENTARNIIFDLLLDKIGLALALTNLVKQIEQEPESEVSPEVLAEINAQEENPLIDISKLVVI